MNENVDKELNNFNGYNNSSNTFNLVIGVATLLIALLGATFAYFSATARSKENDVTVKSAYVSIYYDGGTEIKASNLVPATEQVALIKYQKQQKAYDPEVDGDMVKDYDQYNSLNLDRKCVDAKGKEVCYVYQFSVRSDGAENEETEILASINVNQNEFDNLSYVLYKVTLKEDENGNVIKDRYGFGLVDEYEVVSTFENVDTNPDNVDFTNVKFATLEKPQEIYGENNEVLETVNPVACLFGYKQLNEDQEPYKINDSARCEPHKIKNKEKHTYQLVIWLEETGEVQEEQGLFFRGTVVIEVSGGVNTSEYENGKITGTE